MSVGLGSRVIGPPLPHEWVFCLCCGAEEGTLGGPVCSLHKYDRPDGSPDVRGWFEGDGINWLWLDVTGGQKLPPLAQLQEAQRTMKRPPYHQTFRLAGDTIYVAHTESVPHRAGRGLQKLEEAYDGQT